MNVKVSKKQPDFGYHFSSNFLVEQPAMDIHRCKFSEWMPSAACATVFHPELPYLAVGRENGDIELWNVEEKWFCEIVFHFGFVSDVEDSWS